MAGTSAEARELFRRGEAAYSAGNYDLAIREWNSAYAADPRPRIQFNLSQAYERLGELEKAMDALRKFLDSGDPDDPMYSDANARLSALNQRMAVTGVVVQGGREGGSILVDDKDWGRTPRPDKIPLSPGSHALLVKWPDGREFRTNVMVPAGQVVNVGIPEEVGGTAPVSDGATEASGSAQVDSAGWQKQWPWFAGGGAAVALGAAGIIYGAVRGGASSDCGGTTFCNQKDVDSADSQSMTGYIVGGTLVAVGAALIVVGVLKTNKDKETAQAGTQCGVGLASATCRIRF